MISKLIYRCPACSGFDWLQGDRCVHCGASVREEHQSLLTINNRRATIAHWYDRVLAFDLPAGKNGLIFESGNVKLHKEKFRQRYAGPGGVAAILYSREFVDRVSAVLFRDRIELAGKKRVLTIPFATLLSVTIESNVIIVVDRTLGPLFLEFLQDSGKKWEDGIRRALVDYKKPAEIVEFFPRIILGKELKKPGPDSPTRRPLYSPGRKPESVPSHPVYLMARRLVRAVVSKGLQIDWSGREHIPEKGSAVLLGNHSSFLDAILLETLTPRNIWFMTKDSQYKGRFMTWFLGLAKSFPVRRYTVDVQAVRNAIKVVQNGHILGIFPEGERSWDGRMLPFKRGTMRLVLALGAPVIPVGISGAYGLMPRWTHRVKRVPVHIRFGRPVRIKPVSIGAQTEKDIAAVTEQLTGRIQALIR